MGKIKDLTGQRFGKLVVQGYAGISQYGKTQWNCRCDCGNTTTVTGSHLRSGYTKSCGCFRSETSRERRRKGKGVAALNQLIALYRQGARRRGYSWDLSDEQAVRLFSSSCVYCGAVPSNVLRSRNNTGDFIYNGIDRVDNTRGYSPDNVVPCCETCNKAKRAMGEEEFLEWVARVYRHRELYKELI